MTATTFPALLAWSSSKKNTIKIVELDTEDLYATFVGVQVAEGNENRKTYSIIQLSAFPDNWTHVKEIANTKLLISLNHVMDKSANLEIFDISCKTMKKIYSFEEVHGCNLESTNLN